MVLSVPHSGRDYPDWLVDMSSSGRDSLVALDDPLVDRLVWRAMQRGVGAVIAQAPRAAIDCNRSADEIDPSVIDGAGRGRATARARGGLGIVPARTQQHGYLWRRAIGRSQLGERLEQAHRPYHQALQDQLGLLVDRFGCALLLDCHSMPAPPQGVPPVVFGDCHGQAADPWLSLRAVGIAAAHGFEASLNDPFAGGYVTERHGDPSNRVHALQIEIDRRCYLDAGFQSAGAGFDKVAALFDALAKELGEELLGRRFATAAE